MDASLQRRVQRYGWDRAAESYERLWAAQLRPPQQRLLAMAALEPGERVLDVACGTGLVTWPAAEAVGPTGSVLATDLSDRMVERATAEAERRGLPHVSCRRMGAESLDVPDGSVEAALCALGLMYVPEPLTALREMHRALASGGRAVVAVWGARARCGWAEIFPIVERRVSSEVCPMFFQLGNGTALRQTLAQAGFDRIEDERLSVELVYDNEQDAIDAAFAGGPVAMAYSRFDEAARLEAHAEYVASIAPYRHGGGFRVPGEFVIARGERVRPTR